MKIHHVAITVNNLKKTITQLKTKAIHCTQPTLGASGHNYSFLTDPNGISIELCQEPPVNRRVA